MAAYDVDVMTKFIQQEATKRGIDPEIALKVARSEGLGAGIWQSNLGYKGGREQSYGPFQLFVGGGLGDKFQRKYGKSPADPSTVYDQVTFALDEAKTGGWTPWHGWKGDRWAGISDGGGGGSGSTETAIVPTTNETAITNGVSGNSVLAGRTDETSKADRPSLFDMIRSTRSPVAPPAPIATAAQDIATLSNLIKSNPDEKAARAQQILSKIQEYS